MRRIVSPYFRSHLLVSEANVSDVLFLGFYSDQRGFVLKREAVSRCEIPCRPPEQERFRAGATR
ncbi:MAG: hypothetical protein PHV27_12230, partial [Mesotoga sp.]|uniref:hypothetical protein n=1 Tax=Mesotoga sp. TaxID=2053577 RepID=UPI00262F2672